MTTENETEKTGWIAYYIWGKGGNGYDTPHYIQFDITGYEDASIAYEIVHSYEHWAIHAEYYNMRWEDNVVPPQNIIEKHIADSKARLIDIQKNIDSLTEFKAKYYSED